MHSEIMNYSTIQDQMSDKPIQKHWNGYTDAEWHCNIPLSRSTLGIKQNQSKKTVIKWSNYIVKYLYNYSLNKINFTNVWESRIIFVHIQSNLC
jgi:hypothetical protein